MLRSGEMVTENLTGKLTKKCLKTEELNLYLPKANIFKEQSRGFEA
ncbi:hypothetical protein JNK13_01560 [bacterium]|nr:hypothetical protein [bacterium]